MRHDMSQEMLSGKAGIATRYLQEIEAGEKQPSVTMIFKLARAFDIHYCELLNSAWMEWFQSPDQTE